MSKYFKPLLVTLTVLSIAFVGCQKKITKVEPTPEPPPPVVQETPPPPPPPAEPIQEDIGPQLNQVLQTVYFDFDKFDLKPDAISTLGAVASFMKDHPSVRVMAEGNTDERGSAEYNMGLGENRAKAVKSYLTSYGISSDRIETTSYGEERPAQTGCGNDDNCFSKNRRVEWQVLAK
jgi:peptidoglycan-associated lipoprotein